MLERIGKFRQIRTREGTATSLMFSYIFCLMAFDYILKPLRSALFLRDIPASDLPNAYLLTALMAGPLIFLVYKLGRRLSAVDLVTSTNLGIIVSLLLLKWAIARQLPFMPYVYFVFVQIVSVLCVAQFWLLAGYVFDGRQAKRIYGLLGAGALAGAIGGSLITDLLKHESTATMLNISAVLCLALIALARVVWRHRLQHAIAGGESARGMDSSGRTLDMFRTVSGSRLLRLMILLMLLTMIASQIADWQLDYAAQENFKNLPKQLMEYEIKSFRARLNWVTSLIGIGIQMGVTHFVIQRLGIWAAVLFLPIGLGISSFGVLLAPSLKSAAVALGCDSVFRYSINRTGAELLYLPLSAGMRRKVKLFIDVFADRVGKAVAAFIILALTSRYMPIGLKGTALMVASLTVASTIIALKLRRSYVEAFRQQLTLRGVDLSEINRYVTDPASLHLLVSALESPQERQVLYALGLLQSAREYDFSPQLLPLLKHPSSLVRAEAARTLQALPGSRAADAEALLEDSSEGVRMAAMEYLCLHDPDRTDGRLQELLRHRNPHIRIAAGRCAAVLPDLTFRPSMELIRSLLSIDGNESLKAHEAAARLAGRLPEALSVPFLHQLLRDPRPEVVAAAVMASGQTGRLELAPEILPLLSNRELRPACRQALVFFGTRIVADLSAALADEKRDPAVRREIPWILGRIPDASAGRSLVENLNAGDFRLKYLIAKALSRMHAGNPGLPGHHRFIEVHAVAQIMAYYEELALSRAFEANGSRTESSLVGRILRERLAEQLEIVFRLLGLIYPQRDIYFAYSALQRQDRARRASALEFLENILGKDFKPLIMPLLEEESPERLLARAARFFSLNVPAKNEALSMLLEQPDPWLRTCALYAVGSERNRDREPICRQLLRNRDPHVREMAGWALDRISATNTKGLTYADKFGKDPVPSGR